MSKRKYLHLTEEGARMLLNEVKLKYVVEYQRDKTDLNKMGSTDLWKEIGSHLKVDKIISNYQLLNTIDAHWRNEHGRYCKHPLSKLAGLIEWIGGKNENYGIVSSTSDLVSSTSDSENIGISDDTNPFQINSITRPLYKKIVDTNWFLFTFHESTNFSDKTYGIAQAIIKFKEDENVVINDKKRWCVQLFTIEHGEVSSYSGFFGIRKTDDRHIYLETFALELPELSSKHLRLMLYFGKRQINELALGVFYNIRFHGAFLAGSAVMVAATDSEYNVMTIDNQIKVYESKEELPDQYRKSIWPFFERRNLNYIKLPDLRHLEDANIFSLSGLEHIVNNHYHIRNRKEFWLPKYHLFISIPLTFTKSEELYNNNNGIAMQAIQKFKELNIPESDIYFAGKNRNFTHMELRTIIPKETIEALERSSVFVLIVPNLMSGQNTDIRSLKISSAFTELGYAMALDKKILIFRENHNVLPNNVDTVNNEDILILPFRARELDITFAQNENQIKQFLDIAE